MDTFALIGIVARRDTGANEGSQVLSGAEEKKHLLSFELPQFVRTAQIGAVRSVIVLIFYADP